MYNRSNKGERHLVTFTDYYSLTISDLKALPAPTLSSRKGSKPTSKPPPPQSLILLSSDNGASDMFSNIKSS